MNAVLIFRRSLATVIIYAFSSICYGQVPVANFSGSPLQGCSPLIVTFQNQSSGNPTSFSWSFGNGNTSTLVNPSATYFTPGTYTVTLTATNARGSNTKTRVQYITVFENPTADFTAFNTNGCYPLRVQFSDRSTAGTGNNIVSWQWDFGNGSTSNQQNPFYSYNSSGNYSVTLKVTNDKGCTRTISKTNLITVQPGVKAIFTHSDPTVCRAPATISFTNSSTGPGVLNYQWDFGDGNTSSATNPIHTYGTNGSFIATLVVTSSAGCVDTLRSNPIFIGANITEFNYPTQICVNDTANFTNASSPVPISSRWDFGDGGTATTRDTRHNYGTPGVYTVKLYNTYSSCADSTSHTITVNGLPIVDFSASPLSQCKPPLTVNFTDLTPNSASWHWDFGDGGSSTLQNPSHTYTTYGRFNVKLIVTSDAGCIDSVVKSEYVIIRKANISIPQLPDKGCVPYTISPVPVIDAVDNVLTYDWDFGDGGTSTLQNPTHTYTVQGTYTVRLIITTSGGCRDTLTMNSAVKVGTIPFVDFSATPIPVCGNQPVQFTDLSHPVDAWTWDFGDGGSESIQNPIHRYADTGYFSVTLTAYNNGCRQVMTKPNYIYVLPAVARFNYSADCSDRLRFQFRDSSILPLTWSWNFGDGGVSNSPNPLHGFPALGNYPVTLIVTNGSCADTVTRIVRALDERPDFTASARVACKKTNIDFTVSGANFPNIASYQWDFGDGNIANSTATSIGHTYLNSGNYSVTLTATDLNGCSNVLAKSNFIRINGPTASFTPSTNACARHTTVISDGSLTDGVNPITNWYFDFGDGQTQNFSAPPFQHSYNTAGAYSIKMIITDAAGCIDSVRQTDSIRVTDPKALFNSNDTLTCAGQNVNFANDSYPGIANSLWDFGDGGSSTISQPTHAYADTGLYTVKLIVTDSYGCTDSLVKNLYVRVKNPKASFTASDTASSCAPFQVLFTNGSINYNSSYWDFGPGEGTSTSTDPTHYFSTPGNYPVKLMITSPGGCRDSVIKWIHLYDTVGSRITYSPLSGCKPLLVSISAFTPGVIKNYFWDFGDGNTITTQRADTDHIYSSYGDYLPKLIMKDPTGCIIPVSGVLPVHSTGAKANFGAVDSVFCDLAHVQFADSTTFNDVVTNYNWSFGDGNGSTLQEPSHDYGSPGLYTVRLIVRTQLNCIDTFSKVNYIRVVRRPIIDIAGDTIICAKSPLQHKGIFILPDTSIVRWAWNFPNGSGSQLQVPLPQIYTAIGTFVVQAIAMNSTGCKDTATQTIHVLPLPVATMPGSMTVQNGFPVQVPATYSPNTVRWIWSPGTGLSCADCPTPYVGPKFNTNYQVYFTDNNGCSNIATLQVVTVCKNMNLFLPNTFSPNSDGNNDVFYPRGRGLERMRLLRIFNRWGEVVFEKKDFPINDASVGWDGKYKGQLVPPGVYVYQSEVFCENGELITINGNVSVIR